MSKSMPRSLWRRLRDAHGAKARSFTSNPLRKLMPWLYFTVFAVQDPICLCTLYCSICAGRFVPLRHLVLLFSNRFLREEGRFLALIAVVSS